MVIQRNSNKFFISDVTKQKNVYLNEDTRMGRRVNILIK